MSTLNMLKPAGCRSLLDFTLEIMDWLVQDTYFLICFSFYFRRYQTANILSRFYF